MGNFIINFLGTCSLYLDAGKESGVVKTTPGSAFLIDKDRNLLG